jgi:hypothetical protein
MADAPIDQRKTRRIFAAMAPVTIVPAVAVLSRSEEWTMPLPDSCSRGGLGCLDVATAFRRQVTGDRNGVYVWLPDKGSHASSGDTEAARRQVSAQPCASDVLLATSTRRQS